MASLVELQDALVNADRAGDTQAATQIADAISAMQSSGTSGGPLTRMDKFKAGLKDPLDGGAQLITKMLPDGVVKAGNSLNNWISEKTGLVGMLPDGGVDQQVKEQEKVYQARRALQGEDGIDGYRLLGNIASPANLAIGASMPTTAATLGGRMGLGALGGAMSAGISPVVNDGSFAAEKLKQLAIGGAAGGAMPAIAAGVSRVISPKASVNPDVKMLQDAGVQPTIGQTLGGRVNAMEEKMQSVPIMGDAIANARGKALRQFNEAAINRSVSPVGGKIDGVGQSAVAQAGDMVSQAYDDALGSLKFVRFDDKFKQDIGQLSGMAQDLTPPMRARFTKIVNDIVDSRTTAGGTMLAPTLKKVDSELGKTASRYGGSSVASEQELADAVKQLQQLLREQVARSSPEASKAMRAADAGYANLVRIEGAAKAAKNTEGLFTPAQLNTAIQTADKSVRKRAVARGEALMQDLGTAGQNVLGNKVPNSGTADRMWLGAGAIGAGALHPAIPLGLAGGAAAYTPWGQELLRRAVTSRPSSAQSVAELLNRASPMLGATGGLLGLDVLK